MSAKRIQGRSTIWSVLLMGGLLVEGLAWGQTSRSASSSSPAGATRVASSGGTRSVSAPHRGHGSRYYGRPHYRARHGAYFGWSPYWGASWSGYWGSYWGSYWWDPYWYGPRVGYSTVYPGAGATYGALDTDISPERAEVWIDGRMIGRADDFDGFPTYLWLEKGTYDVVFYLPDFKTIARQYSIYPGLVIDVEDRMERGEAIHPLDLVPKSSVNRDERLRRDRERLETSPPSWETQAAPGSSEEWLDVRSEPGRLLLAVEPADASVYLDGRFVGTGSDLGRLRAGLLVDSGAHSLEIVRPGYLGARREVVVEQGDETELRVVLEPAEADPL